MGLNSFVPRIYGRHGNLPGPLNSPPAYFDRARPEPGASPPTKCRSTNDGRYGTRAVVWGLVFIVLLLQTGSIGPGCVSYPLYTCPGDCLRAYTLSVSRICGTGTSSSRSGSPLRGWTAASALVNLATLAQAVAKCQQGRSTVTDITFTWALETTIRHPP